MKTTSTTHIDNQMENMTRKEYWEHRAQEGAIYGWEPSVSARLALPYIRSNEKLLEIGGAYGRNGLWFAKNDIEVTNIDLSNTWIEMAEQSKGELPLQNICGDILTSQLPGTTYDAAFSNFVLHFFTSEELNTVFNEIRALLKDNGLFINAWLSEHDEYAQTGYSGGQYLHCFTQKELEDLHAKHNFALESITELKELELINARDRKTVFWFTVARRIPLPSKGEVR